MACPLSFPHDKLARVVGIAPEGGIGELLCLDEQSQNGKTGGGFRKEARGRLLARASRYLCSKHDHSLEVVQCLTLR